MDSLIDWIWKTGGIKYHKTSQGTYEGELRDIFTDFKNGKKVRAKGVTATLLNNKRGRGLDEILTEANSDGFLIADEDELIELLEKDRIAKAEKNFCDRVLPLRGLPEQEELLWQQYLKLGGIL